MGTETEELRSLAAQLRAHLEWRRRFGDATVPAAPTPRVGGAPAAAPAAGPPDGPTVDEAAAPEELVEEATVAALPGPAAAGETPAAARLAAVREELGDCQRCKLAPTRHSLVFGVGSPTADLMFVGEGPGADEDRLGEPFVGAAGQLLDKMIAAMGLRREEVYICNIVKCRPPRNRDPEPDEVDTCKPFLLQQIAAIRPRLIVALGKPAAQCLLQSTAPIGALRGRWHDFEGVPLMPTYHPAALLRNEGYKRPTWEDLKQVMAEMDRLGLKRRG
jgi:DNA polymerase